MIIAIIIGYFIRKRKIAAVRVKVFSSGIHFKKTYDY